MHCEWTGQNNMRVPIIKGIRIDLMGIFRDRNVAVAVQRHQIHQYHTTFVSKSMLCGRCSHSFLLGGLSRINSRCHDVRQIYYLCGESKEHISNNDSRRFKFRNTTRNRALLKDDPLFIREKYIISNHQFKPISIMGKGEQARKISQKNGDIASNEPSFKEVNSIEVHEVSHLETLWQSSQANLKVTVITFDIETTGLKLGRDRIVEFAARDMAGGHYSTFHTLVNPEILISTAAAMSNGITNEMVNKPEIPRWKDVATALLKFVESRRDGDGIVLLVAHNGKRFDVPFIIKEFQDCAIEIPFWWQFLDTMPLAREALKASGIAHPRVNLASLCEHYALKIDGKFHRALTDANALALLLGKLVNDLKLPLVSLLEKSFKADDVLSTTKYFQRNFAKDSDAGAGACSKVRVDSTAELVPDYLSGDKNGACTDFSVVEEQQFNAPWEKALPTVFFATNHQDDFVMESSYFEESDLADTKIKAALSNLLNVPHQKSSKTMHIPLLTGGIAKRVRNVPSLQKKRKTKRSSAYHLQLENELIKIVNKVNSHFSVNGMRNFKNLSEVFLCQSGMPFAIVDRYRLSMKLYCINNTILPPMLKDGERKQGKPDFINLFKVGEKYEALADNYGISSYGVDISAPLLLPMLTVEDCIHHSMGSLKGVLQNSKEVKELTSPCIHKGCLVAILPVFKSSSWGLAYCDLLTGEFCATQLANKEDLIQELYLLQPVQVNFPDYAECWRNNLPIGMPPEFNYLCRPPSEFVIRDDNKDLVSISIDSICGKISCGLPGIHAGAALLRYIQNGQDHSIDKVKLQKLRLYSTAAFLQLSEATRKHLKLIIGRNNEIEGSVLRAMDRTKTSMGSRMLRKWLLRPLCNDEEILLRQNVVQVLVTDVNKCNLLQTRITAIGDLELVAERMTWGCSSEGDLTLLAKSVFLLQEIVSTIENLSEFSSFVSLINVPPSALEFANRALRMLQPLEVQEAVKENMKKNKLAILLEDATGLLEFFYQASQAVASLDVLCCFADIAIDREYCRPVIVKDRKEITIVSGRHMVDEVQLPSKGNYVSNSAYLGDASLSDTVICPCTEVSHKQAPVNKKTIQVLDQSEKACPYADLVLVFGLDGSGKSSYLEQVGIIQILFQCGSFVPAQEARLSVADSIFMQVGPLQLTSEEGMAEIAVILSQSTSNSVLLFDDFAYDSRSSDADAIVRATIEYISQHVKARCVFSTQNAELHRLESEYTNIKCYHFPAYIDNGEVIFPHAIAPGFPTQYASIILARNVGFPEWVYNRAETLLSDNNSCGVGKEPSS